MEAVRFGDNARYLQLGKTVDVWDPAIQDEGPWHPGVIISVAPLLVKPIGFQRGHRFPKIRLPTGQVLDDPDANVDMHGNELQEGDRVRVQDSDDEPHMGTVSKLHPTKVRPDGFIKSWHFEKVELLTSRAESVSMEGKLRTDVQAATPQPGKLGSLGSSAQISSGPANSSRQMLGAPVGATPISSGGLSKPLSVKEKMLSQLSQDAAAPLGPVRSFGGFGAPSRPGLPSSARQMLGAPVGATPILSGGLSKPLSVRDKMLAQLSSEPVGPVRSFGAPLGPMRSFGAPSTQARQSR
jgi:hypothetical protein